METRRHLGIFNTSDLVLFLSSVLTERVQLLRVQYWREIGEVKLENLVFEGWNRLQFGNDFGVMLAH